MREVIKYQSKDGNIFDTQWECICHERGISKEVVDVVTTLFHNNLTIDTSNYSTVLESLERMQQFGVKIIT